MTFALGIFVIFIIGLGISAILKKSPILCYPVAVFLTSITLYIFAILDQLLLGKYCVFALAAIGMVMYIRCFILQEDKKSEIITLIKKFIIPFCLLTAYAFIFTKGRVPSFHDDFSHWGTVVRRMYLTNRLYTIDSPGIWFREYPPCLSLLEWFVCSLRNTLVMSDAYGIYVAITIICLMPISEAIKTKKTIGLVISLVITIILSPLLLGASSNAYSGLHADEFLSVVFAYSLIVLHFEQNRRDRVIFVSFAFAVLTLSKPAGISFALFGVITAIVEIYNTEDTRVKNYRIGSFLKEYREIFLYVLTIGIAKASWAVHLRVNDITTQLSSIPLKDSINVVLDLINGKADVQTKSIISECLDYLINPGFYESHIYIPIGISMITMYFAAIVILKKNQNNKLMRLLITSIVCTCLFSISTVFVMVTKLYSSNSFDRYLYTVMSAYFIFAVSIVVAYSEKTIPYIAIVLIVLLSVVDSGKIKLSLLWPFSSIHIGQSFYNEHMDIYVPQIENTEAKVLLISQDTEFSTSPMIDHRFLYYISQPYNLNLSFDTWLTDGELQKSVDDCMNNVLSYDYVYLYKIRDDFWENKDQLFSESMSSNTWYKVTDKGTLEALGMR